MRQFIASAAVLAAIALAAVLPFGVLAAGPVWP
jgi:hypothetical protein